MSEFVQNLKMRGPMTSHQSRLKSSARRPIVCAARLEQVPDSPLGFVNPDLDQARARRVTMLFTHSMRFAQISRELLVVFAQLCQHVGRRYMVRLVVQQPLPPRYFTDRAQRHRADLPDPLRNGICRGIKL